MNDLRAELNTIKEDRPPTFQLYKNVEIICKTLTTQDRHVRLNLTAKDRRMISEIVEIGLDDYAKGSIDLGTVIFTSI